MMTRNPFPYKNDENKENFASSENKTVRRHKSLMNIKSSFRSSIPRRSNSIDRIKQSYNSSIPALSTTTSQNGEERGRKGKPSSSSIPTSSSMTTPLNYLRHKGSEKSTSEDTQIKPLLPFKEKDSTKDKKKKEFKEKEILATNSKYLSKSIEQLLLRTSTTDNVKSLEDETANYLLNKYAKNLLRKPKESAINSTGESKLSVPSLKHSLSLNLEEKKSSGSESLNNSYPLTAGSTAASALKSDIKKDGKESNLEKYPSCIPDTPVSSKQSNGHSGTIGHHRRTSSRLKYPMTSIKKKPSMLDIKQKIQKDDDQDKEALEINEVSTSQQPGTQLNDSLKLQQKPKSNDKPKSQQSSEAKFNDKLKSQYPRETKAKPILIHNDSPVVVLPAAASTGLPQTPPTPPSKSYSHPRKEKEGEEQRKQEKKEESNNSSPLTLSLSSPLTLSLSSASSPLTSSSSPFSSPKPDPLQKLQPMSHPQPHHPLKLAAALEDMKHEVTTTNQNTIDDKTILNTFTVAFDNISSLSTKINLLSEIIDKNEEKQQQQYTSDMNQINFELFDIKQKVSQSMKRLQQEFDPILTALKEKEKEKEKEKAKEEKEKKELKEKESALSLSAAVQEERVQEEMNTLKLQLVHLSNENQILKKRLDIITRKLPYLFFFHILTFGLLFLFFIHEMPNERKQQLYDMGLQGRNYVLHHVLWVLHRISEGWAQMISYLNNQYYHH